MTKGGCGSLKTEPPAGPGKGEMKTRNELSSSGREVRPGCVHAEPWLWGRTGLKEWTVIQKVLGLWWLGVGRAGSPQQQCR